MKKVNKIIEKPKNIFIDYYPHLDLHGMDRYSAVYETKKFIKECTIMRKTKCVIVHGKGSLILKNEVHKYLKTDKAVTNFKLDYFNTGCTVIDIDINKK